MLKLMYITNRPEIAKIIENAGIDRVFVDMEYIGKKERQAGMDTVQSSHSIEDLRGIRACVTKAEILVRCNPIHCSTPDYYSSADEINDIIKAGADIIMLPYFKTVNEVKTFIQIIDGRAKTLLLIETPEAVECIDEILTLDGIDEVYVGLNDLSLGYGMKFMFEPLANGTVDMLCDKFKSKGLPYGFGGIASLGKGLLQSEKVIAEHYRLGSTCAILSRSFCNTNKLTDLKEIESLFHAGIKAIRNYELNCQQNQIDFEENQRQVKRIVASISI